MHSNSRTLDGRRGKRPEAVVQGKPSSVTSGSQLTSATSSQVLPHPLLPVDIVIQILSEHARISRRCALKSLLVSKELTSLLSDAVYQTVSLSSVQGMESFQALLRNKPDIGRRIKSLWIAPRHVKSDLIPALAPPNHSSAHGARQRHVQTMARDILRGCRRLDHLALDGGFLTPQAAVAYGTACKPKTLLCVNPHSFLGHFSAPIFKTSVKRLEVVDTTLAVEEVDEIRQMQGLRAFIWTSPRARSDITRDVSVLLRILSPRATDMSPQQSSNDSQYAQMLMASGPALPEKSRKNEKLKSICTSTSHARAAALAASFKKVVETVTVDAAPNNNDDDEDDEDVDEIVRAMQAVKAGGGVYVDSAMANSSALHHPTGVELQTQALSSLMQALSSSQKNASRKNKDELDSETTHSDVSDSDDDDEVVEEWEALRDVVCQRRMANPSASRFLAGVGSSFAPSTSNSGFSTPWGVGSTDISRTASPTPSSVLHGDDVTNVDGGRALQRIWRRWHTQVNSTSFDIFVTQ